MEYVIFPMQTINITQRANNAYSHKNLQALDIAGKDSGIESAYAPCTVKVLGFWGTSHTTLFGSCDAKGKPAKVKIENGEEKILTFALTHDNYIDDIKVGKIFKSGEKIYDEGTFGNATGNHIHMEVAEGWQKKKHKRSDGKYELDNITAIGSIFYQLKDWNVIQKGSGYTFKIVNSRDDNSLESAMKAFQYISGKRELSEEEKKELDVNGNGKVELDDAMKLFKKEV